MFPGKKELKELHFTQFVYHYHPIGIYALDQGIHMFYAVLASSFETQILYFKVMHSVICL